MTARAMTRTTGPASLSWLAHHEFRLAWRDWWSMLTAGKPHRVRVVIAAMLAFALFMHLVAFAIVARFAEIEPDADRGTLVVITGCALLAWSLMMSQAMEFVTRAFYARFDLDLILSSPVAARRVFAVRIGAMAVSTVLMALLLAAPFINVLVWRGGARWLSAYGVVLAVGAFGGGPVGRADGCPVPHHRPEADTARRADRRRPGRRDVRNRAAGGGDPVLRHAVLSDVSQVRPSDRVCAGHRQRRVVAGARGARRSDGACRSPCRRLGAVERRDRDLFGAVRRSCHRRSGCLGRRRAAASIDLISPSSPPRARCGRRNGRCFAATLGSPRRR